MCYSDSDEKNFFVFKLLACAVYVAMLLSVVILLNLRKSVWNLAGKFGLPNETIEKNVNIFV